MNSFTPQRTLTTWLLAMAAATAAHPAPLPGQTPWHEGFEGPIPSWHEAGGDAQFTILQHQRVSGIAHTGQGCEWFQVVGRGGSTAYVGHDIGRPRVIQDLRSSVWVKSDRGGVQFLAAVALPRTADRHTGRPVTTYLVGSTYTDVGRWQQLRIENLPALLTRQLQVLRSQALTGVDGRQAYVAQVLLNIYGGAAVSNVWVDDLEVAGHVGLGPGVGPPVSAGAAAPPGAPPAAAPPAVPPGAASAALSAGPGALAAVPDPARGPPQFSRNDNDPPPVRRREARLDRSVLLVNDYPLFPRAIQYQGEPLAQLKQLGFNAVWLRQVPPPELLREADRLDLWLVCPPPWPAGVEPPKSSLGVIGPEFDPVLAWDLGSGLTGEQIDAYRQWADTIRLADARRHRPLVCSPASNLRGYSRLANVLLVDRRPLGTSLEMPDYGTWVRRQPLLALPGTPVWTTIQTQPSEALRRQLAALGGGRLPPSTIAPEQIRLLLDTALSSGSRGALFLSDSPLDAPSAETRQRAMTLQLVNLELDLIEPWVAGGSLAALAESNRREVAGAVLRSGRARIVLPIWVAPGSQCVPPMAIADPLALIVPGVPESSNVYELTAGRLQPLRHHREMGGMRVTLDEFGLSALLLLAQDPLVIEAVKGRASVNGRSSAELEQHLAAEKLQDVTQVLGQSWSRVPPQLNVGEQLTAARADLGRSEARLAAGDVPGGSLAARRAMRPLRLLERTAWEAAMTGLDSPVASPATALFAALPWHWALADRLAASHPGPNRLSAGDFEAFALMLQSGWRNFERPIEGVQTAADLVPEACHSGRLGLRLTARADDPENPPALLETPPLWITSPAVPLVAGQVVVIHAWVNIPKAITGSVDGLLVFDSIGGADLALRIDRTAGWRELTMFRAAGQSGPMSVTFALSGLGEVHLDDVTLAVLEPAPAGRPAAQGPSSPLPPPR